MNSQRQLHCALIDNTVRTSPGMQAIEPAQILEDEVHDKENRASQYCRRSTINQGQYKWMICQICHTYGVRALTMRTSWPYQGSRSGGQKTIDCPVPVIRKDQLTILDLPQLHKQFPTSWMVCENMVKSVITEFGRDLLSRNSRRSCVHGEHGQSYVVGGSK